MEHTFLLMIVGLTSVGTYLLGTKGLRLHGMQLWRGLGKTCEIAGLTLIFFAVNLIVGVIIVYAARKSLGRFVSLYHLSDTTLLVLSLLQAMIFQAWRASSRQRAAADDRRSQRLGRDCKG